MNKQEREWLAHIKLQNCVLYQTDECSGEIEAHHLTSGGRRLGHEFAISLCSAHHRTGPIGIGYHNGTKPWVEKYGNQLDLLNKQRAEQGLEPIYPTSKIVPRNSLHS